MNTLLLVEDDLETQDMMLSILKKEYAVRCATNSTEAWSALEDRAVDLVLMDLSLRNNENGLVLARKILDREEYRHIPIIAVTAHAFPTDRMKCINAGCTDYLPKPLRVSELKAMISRHLQVGVAVPAGA